MLAFEVKGDMKCRTSRSSRESFVYKKNKKTKFVGELMWEIKYKPQSISELVVDSSHVSSIKEWLVRVDEGNIIIVVFRLPGM
jgi:hypothetical protein